MDWHGLLALWCAVFGALALIGYGRSLAGVTRVQRTVRVRGRIERVREPRHGGSLNDGIPVVVSFRDPSTGQEFTVTNDGEHGERVTTAWTGREIGVRYLRGRPHGFRFTSDLSARQYGLGWPNFAVFLVYVGLVVVAAIDWGWPWALLGFSVPWTVSIAYYLPESARDRSRHLNTLDSMSAVPARVVAVLKNVHTDEDGHTSTTLMPVVAFTTHGGTAVTAYCASGQPVLGRGPVRQEPARPVRVGLRRRGLAHVADPEVFVRDEIVLTDHRESGLVRMVEPLTANLAVQPGDPLHDAPVVGRPVVLAAGEPGEGLLRGFELRGGDTPGPRVGRIRNVYARITQPTPFGFPDQHSGPHRQRRRALRRSAPPPQGSHPYGVNAGIPPEDQETALFD